MASPSSKGTALARLFKIITLLHGRGRVTQQDMAEACQCSDRQIRRDLQALELANVPIHYDRGQRRYLLDPHWTPYQLTLTLSEALALLLARQATAGRSG